MKLLLYINTLARGGAERVISQLANRFSQRGDEVVLVTSFKTEGEYRVCEAVRRIELEPCESKKSRLKKNVDRIIALRQVCKREQPDIAVSFMLEPNFRLLIATIGLSCKKIVSIRNDPEHEYAGFEGAVVGKVLLPLLADGVVFQTKGAARWFSRAVRKKSAVIANAVDEGFFNSTCRNDGHYWVAVGRLTAQKNYPLMIKAFANVLASYPDENLKIYGTGELEATIKDLIEEIGITGHVELCGRTDDVSKVLSGAKGFLMTSDYEGMPNALMEALAMGLPCISSDCPCGGPGELISTGENGILFPVGDSDRCALAIVSLLEDTSYAHALGESARKRSERFRPERIFTDWATYFDGIGR